MIGLDLMGGAGTLGNFLPMTQAEINWPWSYHFNYWPGTRVYYPSRPPTPDSKVWIALTQTMGQNPGEGSAWRLDERATADARDVEAADPLYQYAMAWWKKNVAGGKSTAANAALPAHAGEVPAEASKSGLSPWLFVGGAVALVFALYAQAEWR